MSERTQEETLKELKTKLREQKLLARKKPWMFYEPLQKQQMFHKDPSQIVFVLGGNRSGKTFAGGKEANDYAAIRKPGMDRPTKIIIGARDYSILAQVVWPAFTRFFEPHECPDSCIGWLDKRRRIPQDARLPNGTHVICRTFEMGPEKFASFDKVDAIWLDECPPFDVYKECRMRLIDRGGRMWITMTPWWGKSKASSPMWVFTNVIVPFDNGDLKGFNLHYWNMEDNIHISQDEVQKVKQDIISDEELDARLYGKFRLLVGNPVFDQQILLAMRRACSPPLNKVAC